MSRRLFCLAIWLAVAAWCDCWLLLPVTIVEAEEERISIKQFVLISEPKRFLLQFVSPEEQRRVIVPRDWLIEPGEEKSEQDGYVSSFNYNRQVTSFPIGNGKIGIHLSSFDFMKEGSAQAAAGRDIFLIYDPKASLVRKGLLDLGITKERLRDMGCFSAKTSHFLAGDINGDGLADIGVVREELKCEENDDAPTSPVYKQSPVSWYPFKENCWKNDARFSGTFPQRYSDLPLIGIIMSPVDYAAYMTWKSHDPSKWNSGRNRRGRTPLTFLPRYRKKLIEDDLKKHGR